MAGQFPFRPRPQAQGNNQQQQNNNQQQRDPRGRRPQQENPNRINDEITAPTVRVVGEKEAEDGKVSVRAQGEGDKGQMTIAQFAEFMKDLVAKEIEANK